MMIANVISGRVKADADDRVIGERLVPVLQSQPGYQSGYWLRQPNSDEVLAVTFWESEDALRAAMANPTVTSTTARTSSMFIGGPKIAVYELVAQG